MRKTYRITCSTTALHILLGCWWLIGSTTTGFSAAPRAIIAVTAGRRSLHATEDNCRDNVVRRTFVGQESERITTTRSSCLRLSRSAFLASLVAIPAAAAVAGQEVGDTNKTAPPSLSTGMVIAGTSPAGAQAQIAREETISGFVAGAALAATKTVVKYPLDTATVRLQMPNSRYSIRHPLQLLDGSYRGVLSPLLANIPAGAVFFAVKDLVKAYLTAQNPESSRWTNTAIAVGVAQFPYWVVRNPSEVVKTRQQAGIEGYDQDVGVWEAYQQVRASRIQQEQSSSSSSSTASNDTYSGTKTPSSTAGLDAFYTGYWENILYAYPADVIKFVAYEQLTGGRKNLPPAEGALAGATATAIAQLFTTPLDVVRNRIMAEEASSVTLQSDSGIDGGDKRSKLQQLSYTERLVQLARVEGLTGLFAGAAPRIGKALVSGAIQFATYEETKIEIAKLFQRQ